MILNNREQYYIEEIHESKVLFLCHVIIFWMKLLMKWSLIIKCSSSLIVHFEHVEYTDDQDVTEIVRAGLHFNRG